MKCVTVPTCSFIQRTNRVRTLTLGFGFCSVLYEVGFYSVRLGFLHFLTFGIGLRSVLGKTWVLVRFVLAGFGFLPISKSNFNHTAVPDYHTGILSYCQGPETTKDWCEIFINIRQLWSILLFLFVCCADLYVDWFLLLHVACLLSVCHCLFSHYARQYL